MQPNLMTERQQREAEFHDQWAKEIDIEAIDPAIAFTAKTAIETQFILQDISKSLGPLESLTVLDMGCGAGESAVYFAKQGARVLATDISPGFIHCAHALAAHHQVQIDARVCASEAMPFEGNSCDVVFANGVLHHVDIPPTMQEVQRLLRVGGKGYFIEPLPYNPVINVYRYMAREVRTVDEKPLTLADVQVIRDLFPKTTVHYFWLTTLIVFLYFFLVEGAHPGKVRYWKKVLYDADKYQWFFQPLAQLDAFLFRCLPPIGLLCWTMVIAVEKE